CWKEKFSAFGSATSTALAVTVNVTGIVTGAFVAAVELMVIVPAYCPAASPLGLADTVSTEGAGPVPETVNQLPPDAVVAVTVNGSPDGTLVTVICTSAGAVPSCWYENATELGLATSEPERASCWTVKLTGVPSRGVAMIVAVRLDVLALAAADHVTVVS